MKDCIDEDCEQSNPQSLTNFYKNNNKLHTKCKSCFKRLYSEGTKQHRIKYKDHYKKYYKEWSLKNKDKTNARARKYCKNHPDKVNAKTNKRRAYKLNCTPKWLTKEHYKQIEIFYTEAIRLTKETGIIHTVDHIIPLKGKTMSGLHVPWNLQVITKSANSSKGNRIS